jgi:hypothetical protein
MIQVMIEAEDFKFPQKMDKRKPTECERKKAFETLEYLESLPFRPFSEEW